MDKFWSWSSELRLEVYVWSWSLKLNCRVAVVMSEFEAEVWNWMLKLKLRVKFEIEDWCWSLMLQFEFEVRSWRLMFTIRYWSLQMVLLTDMNCQGIFGLLINPVLPSISLYFRELSILPFCYFLKLYVTLVDNEPFYRDEFGC